MAYVSDIPPGSREILQREEWIRGVCRIGQRAECCRYLVCDGGGFDCAKHTDSAVYLDLRVLSNTINAQGDNCPGLRKTPPPSAEPPEFVA